MEREIKELVAYLGIRRDQAIRMIRQRRALERAGYRGNSNLLK